MGGSLRGGCRATFRDRTMNKALLAGCMLAALTTAVACAATPSLCTRLAEEARHAPAATWAAAEPLAPWLKPVGDASPSATVKALATDARWRDMLAAMGEHPLGVQQLPGEPIYLVEDVAGTAACQSLVLVEARPGRPARPLAAPFDLGRMNLCTTQSARFATVLGQPAFVVGGAPTMTSLDLHYRVAPWTGSGWAPSCRLTLRRGATMSPGQRFCPEGSKVCEAGQAVAARLAQAYEANRGSTTQLDVRAFNGGHLPDARLAGALNPPLAEPGAIGDMNPPFPLFGADENRLDPMQTLFSNAAPQRLPVFVDGRWWLAVVGRSGVGWREGDAVLVALFAPPGRAADGVASYQFHVGPAELREVVAADE
jgi:hypothetical protein